MAWTSLAPGSVCKGIASLQWTPEDDRTAVFTQWVQAPCKRPRPATRHVLVPEARTHAAGPAQAVQTVQPWLRAAGSGQSAPEADLPLAGGGLDVRWAERARD